MKADYGFSDEPGEALHVQSAAVPRRQEERDAGLRHLRALRDREAGRQFKPKVFLLADQGFDTYSTLIETRRDLVEKKPVWCSASSMPRSIGWYNYLYGDNTAANELIKKRQSGDDRRACSPIRSRQDEASTASSIPATR